MHLVSLIVFIMYFVENDSVKNYNEYEDPNGSQDPDMSDSKSFTSSSAVIEKSSLDGINFFICSKVLIQDQQNFR